MKPRSTEAARLEADYLARVRVALAGRDASEVDEVIQSVKEHIEEELSEASGDEVNLSQMAKFLEHLGPPESFSPPEETKAPSPTSALQPYYRLVRRVGFTVFWFYFMLLLFGVMSPMGRQLRRFWDAVFWVGLVAGMLLSVKAYVDIPRPAPKRIRGNSLAYTVLFLFLLFLVVVMLVYLISRYQQP